MDKENPFAWNDTILNWLANITHKTGCPRCNTEMIPLRSEEINGDPVIFLECSDKDCGCRVYIQAGDIGKYNQT